MRASGAVVRSESRRACGLHYARTPHWTCLTIRPAPGCPGGEIGRRKGLEWLSTRLGNGRREWGQIRGNSTIACRDDCNPELSPGERSSIGALRRFLVESVETWRPLPNAQCFAALRHGKEKVQTPNESQGSAAQAVASTKIPWRQLRAGSSPAPGTTEASEGLCRQACRTQITPEQTGLPKRSHATVIFIGDHGPSPLSIPCGELPVHFPAARAETRNRKS